MLLKYVNGFKDISIDCEVKEIAEKIWNDVNSTKMM